MFFALLWPVVSFALAAPLPVPLGRFQPTVCDSGKCFDEFVVRRSPTNPTEFNYVVVPFRGDIWFLLPGMKNLTYSETDSDSKVFKADNERLITKQTYTKIAKTDTMGNLVFELKFEFDQTSCTLNFKPHPINLKDDDPSNDLRPCAQGSSLEEWEGDFTWNGTFTINKNGTIYLSSRAWVESTKEILLSSGLYRSLGLFSD